MDKVNTAIGKKPSQYIIEDNGGDGYTYGDGECFGNGKGNGTPHAMLEYILCGDGRGAGDGMASLTGEMNSEN